MTSFDWLRFKFDTLKTCYKQGMVGPSVGRGSVGDDWAASIQLVVYLYIAIFVWY